MRNLGVLILYNFPNDSFTLSTFLKGMNCTKAETLGYLMYLVRFWVSLTYTTVQHNALAMNQDLGDQVVVV